MTWQRISLPSEGAKPPEEERVATLVSTEGPTSYRLVGVAASDPAAGSNPSPGTIRLARLQRARSRPAATSCQHFSRGEWCPERAQRVEGPQTPRCSLESVNLIPSEGAEPPEEERGRDLGYRCKCL